MDVKLHLETIHLSIRGLFNDVSNSDYIGPGIGTLVNNK
jgi:hypothetical protein